MRYSFVIPYYQRRSFWNTLVSYDHFYSDRDDWEVLVMEDRKDDQQEQQWLEQALQEFAHLPIRYYMSRYENFSCPCSTINHGVDLAAGQRVIMTNPECFHLVNVLEGFDRQLERQDGQYLVCGCMSVEHYPEKIERFSDMYYSQRQWYQHSQHAPRNLNFCTCLDRQAFIDIGGFNEEYDKGIGRADVDFIERVGRQLKVVPMDELLVLHQDHPESFPTDRRKELVAINQKCSKFTSRFKKEQG